MADERTKWQEIARLDFSDNQFLNWLSANKAYNFFQNSVASFELESYRAQAAIINGLLTHHLDISDGKYLDLRRISQLLIQFDKLIARSAWLEASNELEGVQFVVKSAFYTRLGDFIFAAALSRTNLTLDNIRLTILATFAYGMAYKWSKDGWQHSGVECAPILALSLVELSNLITLNVAGRTDFEKELAKCSGQMLHTFLFCCHVDKAYSPKKADTRVAGEASSFVLSDKTTFNGKVECGDRVQLLEKIWLLRRNIHFLRRFAWILSHDSNLPLTKYQFLDTQLEFLPRVAHNPSTLAPESISTLDIKIFLFRLSRYQKSCREKLENFSPPWIFYQRPNAQQQQFWDVLNKLISVQGRMESLGLPTMLVIANTLEQIRMPSTTHQCSDLHNLVATMECLESLGLGAEDTGTKTCSHDLAEKYAAAAQNAISEISLPSERDEFASTKTLFPHPDGVNNIEQHFIIERVDQFFEKRAAARSPTIKMGTPSAEVEQSAAVSTTTIPQMQKVVYYSTISTQTELPDEKEEIEKEARADRASSVGGAAELNLILGRLTLHTKTLHKLFVK